eukprot:1141371-Pelagomonas_calceolata.AAC.1
MLEEQTENYIDYRRGRSRKIQKGRKAVAGSGPQTQRARTGAWRRAVLDQKERVPGTVEGPKPQERIAIIGPGPQYGTRRLAPCGPMWTRKKRCLAP